MFTQMHELTNIIIRPDIIFALADDDILIPKNGGSVQSFKEQFDMARKTCLKLTFLCNPSV
jgi:hypothetical protein